MDVHRNLGLSFRLDTSDIDIHDPFMNFLIFLFDVMRTFGVLLSCFLFHTDLAMENSALRQQVAVLKMKRSRPKLSVFDRMFWVFLSKHWKRWADVLIFVNPETVVRWHRAGFRRYWRWISRKKRAGRPCIEKELRELIRTMARANSGSGAPRIHGELLKLGFQISERTVFRVVLVSTRDNTYCYVDIPHGIG